MIYTVTIPGRLPSCNDYIGACRTNRYAGAKMKKDAQSMIIWYLAKLPKFEKPIRLHFFWIEPNSKRDYDNIAWGKKFVLDALQEAGKLPNDNRKFVVGFSDEFGVDKDDPRIEILIEEDK
jgi:Holliday junction resolvase RusA-like endonuclease